MYFITFLYFVLYNIFFFDFVIYLFKWEFSSFVIFSPKLSVALMPLFMHFV